VQLPQRIGFNDIHRLLCSLRQAFGTQIFKKTYTLMVCDVSLLRTTSQPVHLIIAVFISCNAVSTHKFAKVKYTQVL